MGPAVSATSKLVDVGAAVGTVGAGWAACVGSADAGVMAAGFVVVAEDNAALVGAGVVAAGASGIGVCVGVEGAAASDDNPAATF